jgi:hypothetical protein
MTDGIFAVMKYSKVYIDSFGYELPPNVITSDDLEKRLEPLYQALHFQEGQLESITGIQERRFWDPAYPMHRGAIKAAQKALAASGIAPDAVGMLIYGGVCRTIWNRPRPVPWPTASGSVLGCRSTTFPMPAWES